MNRNKPRTLNLSGQGSVEYLLGLSAVFAAMAGLSAVFSDQVQRYLTLLFRVIQLPF